MYPIQSIHVLGREREVIPLSLPAYITKYTEYRMIKVQKKALENLKEGK